MFVKAKSILLLAPYFRKTSMQVTFIGYDILYGAYTFKTCVCGQKKKK